MAMIIITSKKYGVFNVEIDDSDEEKVSNYKWSVNLDNGNFYAGSRINKKRIRLHRFLLSLENPEIFVDHADGNTLNNKRSNLRVVTKSQNNCNRISMRKSLSKYKGVSFDKSRGKWQSHIKDTATGKHMFIGRFVNEIDAARAYNEKAIVIHGEYAKINIINE